MYIHSTTVLFGRYRPLRSSLEKKNTTTRDTVYIATLAIVMDNSVKMNNESVRSTVEYINPTSSVSTDGRITRHVTPTLYNIYTERERERIVRVITSRTVET